MKSITLVSVGLLSSAVAAIGVTGYFAWKSLSGEAEFSPIATQPIAQSRASILPPTSQSIVAVAPSSRPATSAVGQANATSIYSQAENDYLFDLSQALQPTERDRLSAAEQLQLGQKIVSWLVNGADYWTVRQQFDAAFQHSIVGNYPHNRDVYIKFATQHFGPSYQATLAPPVETLPVNSMSEMPLPYGMPSPYDLPVPYGMPEEAYSEPMPMPPFPEAHLHPPFYPEAAPYFPPHFYTQPEQPTEQPPRSPRSPYQTPNQPYPNSPYPGPRNPMPRQTPQPNSNDAGIPGAIEISAPDRSQVY